ncbi:MAG: hypothetical protein HYR88_03665 [Verrucomicrobia bacterium]|nr:hypothetical protein [Verrucomicrobiota bacterium]MBI3868996.1 hypothetical protein [Verrucomicrobiota bacterium]
MTHADTSTESAKSPGAAPELGLAGLLFAAAFTLALFVHPPIYEFQGRRPGADDVLARVLGDGRRLFANHCYLKADAYYHSGYYPTIFDDQQGHQTAHMAADAGVVQEQNTGEEGQFLGAVTDWIDGHSRKHFPSSHSHLDEDAPGGKGAGVEREILPWLELSANLDPQWVENYTVGAFWLRKLGKQAEAERFVRLGLESNPGNVELLFELGRCRFDAADLERARNIWEQGWVRWRAREEGRPAAEQNRFTATQLLLHLALVESRLGRREKCVEWLTRALPIAASPDQIKKRIEEVRGGLPFEPIQSPALESSGKDAHH